MKDTATGGAGPPTDTLRAQYTLLIKQGCLHPEDYKTNIQRLRRLVLMEGLPVEDDGELTDRQRGQVGSCSLRGKIWKILLGVKSVDAGQYSALLAKGPSPQYQKIRKDIDRTFMSDTAFAQSVDQDKLSRSLNAYVNYCSEKKLAHSYVQGGNTLMGTLLYVMPELDAFATFLTVVNEHLPLYLVPNISGVYQGLQALDYLLETGDPELYAHLRAHNYYPQLLMHSILSLGTGTPPLSEVLHLWDFYFAFGMHMNVVCTAAQIVLMRDTLLAHPSPCSMFRSLPNLDAKVIIDLALVLVRQLPDHVYEYLVDHASSSDLVFPVVREAGLGGSAPLKLNASHGSSTLKSLLPKMQT
eukprot:TRINITY_DN4537_c0_g1_i2.p1 TRINITY_DN4537_c0_g1~~TRINITY_DN4537_c0_g1_i2.p1  ORF type:complete len:363 (+),score=46.56 TRINITY_DN4537_c0_g1_i2:24-1091(+)